jgi:hypothetical protein
MSRTTIGFVATLLSTCTSLLQAQLRESTTSTRTSSVLVVRNSGAPAGALPSVSGAAEVTRLSATDLSTLLKPLGYTLSSLAGPWTASVAQRVTAGGRITLDFRNISMLMGHSSSALVNGADGSVQLGIRAVAAGESYLIDCAVHRMIDVGGYRLTAPGGQETTTTSSHILAVYEAPDTQFAYFIIKSTSQYSPFNFDSCTISRVSK